MMARHISSPNSSDAVAEGAVADLLWGDPVGISFDRSVQILEGQARSGGGAREWARAAGARLVRAERRQDPIDLLGALQSAASALSRDPLHPEARYNHALALERLSLVNASSQQWTALATDAPERPEGIAAANRAGRLMREQEGEPALEDAGSLARRSPHRARLQVRDSLLPAWGRALLEGDSLGARVFLHRADSVVGALTSRAADRSAANALNAILRTPGLSWGDAARGHVAYGEGRDAYDRAEYLAARTYFLRAAETLGGGEVDPWLEYFLVATEHQTGAPQRDTDAAFAAVAGAAQRQSLPSAAGSATWARGTLALRRGEAGVADSLFQEAQAFFLRANEAEQLAPLDVLRFDALRYGRGTAELADLLQKALLGSRNSRDVWRHNLLLAAAEFAHALGMTEGARAFHDEDVALAAGLPPARHAESLLLRARFRAGIGDTNGARSDLDQAETVQGQVDDPVVRAWLNADRATVDASLALMSSPREAIGMASRAVDHFRDLAVPVRLVPALAVRARGRLAAGDPVGAEEDLGEAMELLARRSEAERVPALQAIQLQTGADLFEQRAMLRLQAGDPMGALAALELGRGAAATAGGGDHGGASEGLGGVLARLTSFLDSGGPVEEQVIHYAFLDGRLHSWLLSGRRLHWTEHPGSRTELEELVRAASAGILDRTGAGPRRLLEELHVRLLAPIFEGSVRSEAPLVIVPDGVLHHVPWAALVDSTDGRFLVEARVVRLQTSVLGGRTTPEHAGQLPSPRVVLVGDLPAGVSRPSGLAPLPRAADEVGAVASLHRGNGPNGQGTEVFIPPADGGFASVGEFHALVSGAGVVHFAGHAVLDPVRPDRSYLLVPVQDGPDSPGGSWGWTAREIAEAVLPGLRLVVLSACSTLQGPEGRAGALATLAGGFLSAGAHSVVGTVLPVSDAHAGALATNLHRRVRSGLSPAEALREAQIELLFSGDPELASPAAWAPFVVLGR